MINTTLDASVLDVTAALRMIDNDIALFLELAELYLNTVPPQVLQLKSHLEQGNITGANIIVHTVKSTSRSMGAFGLGTAAERMEQLLIKGDLADARTEMPELERLFVLVQKALEDAVKENG